MCRRVNGRGIKYCCFTPPGNRRYTKCRIPSEFFSHPPIPFGFCYFHLVFLWNFLILFVSPWIYSVYISLQLSGRRSITPWFGNDGVITGAPSSTDRRSRTTWWPLSGSARLELVVLVPVALIGATVALLPN